MKYWNILKIIIKNAYIRDLKIPGVVTVNVLNSFVEIIITLTMLSAIFGNIESLAGWSYYQVLFLYALMKTIALINGLVARKGLSRMAKEYVHTGEYDFYLTKPVNSLIMVSLSKPRVYNILIIIFTVSLGIWSVIKSGSEISPWNVFGFLIMFVLAIILFYFLTVISIVPSFWFIRLYSLSDLMNRAIQFMRYPSGIYSLFVRVIFYTALPILAVTYLPAWILFNDIKIIYIIYMIAITLVFGALSFYLWKLGERHYGSASS